MVWNWKRKLIHRSNWGVPFSCWAQFRPSHPPQETPTVEINKKLMQWIPKINQISNNFNNIILKNITKFDSHIYRTSAAEMADACGSDGPDIFNFFLWIWEYKVLLFECVWRELSAVRVVWTTRRALVLLYFFLAGKFSSLKVKMRVIRVRLKT